MSAEAFQKRLEAMLKRAVEEGVDSLEEFHRKLVRIVTDLGRDIGMERDVDGDGQRLVIYQDGSIYASFEDLREADDLTPDEVTMALSMRDPSDCYARTVYDFLEAALSFLRGKEVEFPVEISC